MDRVGAVLPPLLENPSLLRPVGAGTTPLEGGRVFLREKTCPNSFSVPGRVSGY